MKLEFTEKIKNAYDLTILGVYEDKKLSATTSKFNKELNEIISKSIKNSCFTGAINDTLIIFSEKIMLIGLGKQSELNKSNLNKIGGIIGGNLKANKIGKALLYLDNFTDDKNFDIAFGAKLKTYTFDKYFTKNKDKINTILFIHSSNPKKSTENFIHTHAIIDGIITTRNLSNEPSNVLTTSELVKEAEKLKPLGIKIEIFDEKALKKMGANLLLAVGQGSTQPTYMVVMKYTGNPQSKDTIALIGKGVCFDSGGISLKPQVALNGMKEDMTGAATVIGIIESIAKRKLKTNITGVIGIAENMPDGNAVKIGDIITSLSGQTVEILNTDAEGRLLLADCITYTVRNIKPTLMIDFATLTGSVGVALGEHKAGLFSNSDTLAKQLFNAGEKSGDEIWQLPLSKKYNDQTKSTIADMANLGMPEKSAGSITAAEFLHNFTEGTNWAHLDIGSTATIKLETDISPKGPTGFGVQLINKFIEEL